jgi:hypothetical protein
MSSRPETRPNKLLVLAYPLKLGDMGQEAPTNNMAVLRSIAVDLVIQVVGYSMHL